MPRALLLFLILATGACDWWPEQLGGPARHGRMVHSPLSADLQREYGWSGYSPLSTIGPEGLRLFISPSFGAYWYLVDFSPRPAGCYMIPAAGRVDDEAYRRRGCWIVAVTLDRRANPAWTGSPAATGIYHFFVPEEDYREIVHDFDRTAARWPGTTQLMTDGTGLDIERVRGGDVSSMSTKANERLDDPGVRLSRGVQRLLLAYGPSGATPRNYDWTVQPGDDHPCLGTELNTPDGDGFGVGSDPCAQFVARRPQRGSATTPQ